MVSALTFVGHVSVDQVENVNGVNVQPGGAALYAAMAARTLLRDVRLVSVIGKDYEFLEVLKPFYSRNIRVSNMPSTRFYMRYNERWEAQYLGANYGAGSKITASIIPTEELKPGGVVHLSPMHPKKAQSIVDRIKEASPEAKISINTWIGYIKEGKKNRQLLKDLASKTDFFILNESEAKTLTETDSITIALRLLRAKMLIITLGELGAIISKENVGMQLVPALIFPVGNVVDTTGAGDTWCGAFLAAYALTEDLMKSVTCASIISSIKCSGWGFNRLMGLQFKEADDVLKYVIGLKEGVLQKTISDFTKP